MAICIEPLLKTRRKIKFFDDENGKPISDKEARENLRLELSKGHKLFPVGDCYRFDPIEKGCLGHIKSLLPIEDKMDNIELEYCLFKQGKRI